VELYILDSLLRREQVVDRFESCIWTERWASIGDFELRLPSTLASRSKFPVGSRLAMNSSYRVMTVETVEDATDEDGQSTLTVKGRSLEAIMEDRVAKNSMDPIIEDRDKYGFVGKPADIGKNMFLAFFSDGLLSPNDKLPFLQRGTLLPASNIQPPQQEILWEKEIGSVYEFLTSLCETYELGFRLVRNFDASELYFEVYTGNDLTTAQNTLTPIVFSPAMDNLQKTTELTSIEGSKNVAYVFNKWGSRVVYAPGVTPDISGFDRRVVVVKTDDPPEAENGGLTNANLAAYLELKGQEELAKHRTSSIFDGEMNQNSMYKYGIDYNLGDKVEMRNAEGETTIRRVTEQIFVSDQEGERSYPTLSEPNA
jgi:hypothetical protein